MKPSRILLLFLLLVHGLYFPTWNAGFVTDFTGLLERLEGQPASGILTSFGFPAQQQVLNFFLYLFYRLFGTSPLPWYLIHTTMHALNGWLLYLLIRRLGSMFRLHRADFPALAASLLFLLSPYQTEVVVWRVCFNYLLSTALLLGAIRFVADWLEHERKRFPWKAMALFTLALFTFELAFSFPLISMAFLLIWALDRERMKELPRAGLCLLAPQLLLIALYFVINRWQLGVWIGHYGAETHLNYGLTGTPGRLLQYSAKLGGLVRYYPHAWKDSIFGVLMAPKVVLAALGMILAGTGWYFFRFRHLPARFRPAGLMAAFYLAALLPVLPLFFNYLLYVENDRHSYLASAFFFSTFALLAGALPFRWGLFVFLLYLIPNVFLTWKTNRIWQQSTALYHSLLDRFPYPDPSQPVYLLNLPDNLEGVLLFRDYGGHGRSFLDALRFLKRRPFDGTLFEVASYNLAAAGDGVTVDPSGPDSLTVTFNQWGNWWWRDGLGANNYETDYYRFLNQGHSYIMEWKPGAPRGTVLVQEGESWRVVAPAD